MPDGAVPQGTELCPGRETSSLSGLATSLQSGWMIRSGRFCFFPSLVGLSERQNTDFYDDQIESRPESTHDTPK